MKIIILSFLIILNLNAQYIIEYENTNIGLINNIETSKNGYIEAIITNTFVKFIIGTNKIIIFDENFELKNKENYYKKKDNNNILKLLNEILFNIKNTNDNITYFKLNNKYEWKYINVSGEERKGYLIVNSQNELIEFNSFYKNVRILKI